MRPTPSLIYTIRQTPCNDNYIGIRILPQDPGVALRYTSGCVLAPFQGARYMPLHKKKVNHAHLTTTVHIKPIGARALTKHRFGWRS